MFTSGAAKWNILAAYGAQRAHGKTEKQAHRRTSSPLQEHQGRRTTVPARRLQTFLPARVMCSSPTRTRRSSPQSNGRGHRLRRSHRDDPHREPDRGAHHERAPRQAPRPSYDYLEEAGSAADLRLDNGLPPAIKTKSEGSRQFPEPADELHDRRLVRRLDQSRREVVRSRRLRHDRYREVDRWPHQLRQLSSGSPAPATSTVAGRGPRRRFPSASSRRTSAWS